MRISDWSSDVCSSDLNVMQSQQGMVGWGRFHGPYIQAGSADMSRQQGITQIGFMVYAATCRGHKQCTLLHLLEPRGVEQIQGFLGARTVQRNKIGRAHV